MIFAPLAVLAAAALAGEAHLLTVDECVALAVERSPKVRAARADLAGENARTRHVVAGMGPRVSLLAYGAPLYGAEGGLGTDTPYRKDFSRWGPYAHGEIQLVQPLYTFGRWSAGVAAAKGREAIAAEKVREVQHAVRREVRRLFGLRLYALSLTPSLQSAKKILTEAIVKAREMHQKGTGDVTLPDLMRLEYGAGELARYARQAADGAELAGRAVKQAIGLRDDEAIELAGDKLPAAPESIASLDELLAAAKAGRPELAQLALGAKAVTDWEKAERRANAPVLFGALAAKADGTTVRPSGSGASLYNGYNDFFAGGAVGLQFDTNPSEVSAKAAEARAKGDWVAATAALAETGIPLEVFKARQELVQHKDLAAVAEQEIVHTRKWLTFAAAAYGTGTGEAKDVLEGVAANVMAKKALYDHLLGAWEAAAELERVTGRP